MADIIRREYGENPKDREGEGRTFLRFHNIDQTCVTTALTNLGTYSPKILGPLRSAAGPAGPHVPILGMNYYDPFLAAWTLRSDGEKLARATVKVADSFNTALDIVYKGLLIPVA
jgi:hypothetical protein